jgi:aspartate aminotransferase
MAVSRTVSEAISRASWIRRMFEEGLRLRAERGAENVFDFSLGNPDLEPPPALIDALRQVVAQDRPGSHAYMPNAGYPELRRELARRFATATGLPYTAEHIVMTVGAAGALNAALKALVDPGDEVLLLAPFFAEYPFYVTNHGARVVVVETDERCQPVVAEIVAAITPRTRALIVNSPNNPSGVVYPASFFAELEAGLAERGQPLTLLSDEPYRALAFAGVEVPQVPKHVTRTVVCDSWSKALAIPGERLGCIAISPRIADAAELFGACVFTNRILGFVNAPAIWQWVLREVGPLTVDGSRYERRCRRVYGALVEMGYDVVVPQGGFYVFPRTPIPDDLAFIGLLKDEGILAVPGRGFGRPGWVRLSLTVPDDTIERALPGFARALRRARAQAGAASPDGPGAGRRP